MKKTFLTFAGFVLAILLIFTALWFFLPQAGNEFANTKNTPSQNQTKTLHYAALGDSLTQGVGDATNQGGFVPLFAKEIENNNSQLVVKSQNFGKEGDTSAQIYTRMTTQSKIEKGLKNADIITITVGGNDVMKVLRDNIAKISNMTAKSFKKPQAAYQKRLRKIFSTIRKNNPTAQIYVLGIYNPFYLNFPNITVMQTVIDNWNTATQSVVNSENKATFVPINDLLYKGIDGKQAVEENSNTGSSSTSTSSSSSEVQNDLLYTGDHFHPNNTGYQIMADAVYKAYQKVNQ